MSDDWGLMEQWDEPAICEHCEQELEWEDCDQCGGEGTYDAYEDDPLWFDPGDTEPCAQCSGAGGWHWCSNVSCPAKQKEVA